MNVEVQVKLDKFKLRWYQSEIWDLIQSRKCKRLLYIASRRAGKDILCWNLAIRKAITSTCLVFYVLPTYSQGRKAIWDAITIDGIKFTDFIPQELIASMNQNEMKIKLKNDSIIQVIGGDSYNTSLVGTNPTFIVLSEYSLMPPDIFNFIRPILAANGGTCIINGTPRGKNHFFSLYKIAQELPEWEVIVHKASEIQHISQSVLANERSQMDEGLFLQEYECSFERGISGSYYGQALDQLKLRGQINHINWEPNLLVYTAWDIGVNDATTIIFWQQVDNSTVVRIIDCYSGTGHGLDHYVKTLQNKPYNYGDHFAPHDIKVREWGGGAVTRYEKARQLGISFKLIEQVPIIDGIDNVLANFSKFWIDSEKCKSLIDALENYRKQFDDSKNIYLNKPLHNWASNYADSLRYLCLALHKTKKGLTSEEFDRKKAAAMYGNNDLPRFFRDDINYNRYGS